MKKLLALLVYILLINQNSFDQTFQQRIQSLPLVKWIDFTCQRNINNHITYIQKHIDKNWKPLIPKTSHPEFPAAHATLFNAAAAALCSLFRDSCSLGDRTEVDIGKEKGFYFIFHSPH